MEKINQTSVTEFILLGLTDVPELQVPLFCLLFFFYTFTVVCNLSISILIIKVPQLHKPMYFFLCNLSISDLGTSTDVTPKMLRDLLSEKKSITFVGCAAQAFSLLMVVTFAAYMLSAMAYDRYAAICHPLLYYLIINKSVYILLATAVCVSGIITSASLTGCIFHASFYGSNIIDHFFCDVPALMGLYSLDRFDAEFVLFAVCISFGLGSLSVTVTSYIYIVSAILKIPSTTGRQKTFSTCGSHMTSVSLFYLSGFFNYLPLSGSGTTTLNKAVSVIYTLVIPMLNPLIYSLRNQEIKGVVWTFMNKRCYYY